MSFIKKKIFWFSSCVQYPFAITLLYLSICSSCFGEWLPNKFSLNHPFVLGRANELIGLQNRILRVEYFSKIYKSVYQSISSKNVGKKRIRISNFVKNAAFVLWIGYDEFGNKLSVDEKQIIRLKAIEMLESLDHYVGTPLNYLDWQWRSKELISYLTAYDLLLATTEKKLLIKSYENLVKFSANLHDQYTLSFLGISVMGSVRNNHALMVDAALGLAGLVLNNNPSSKKWLHTSLYNIHDVLFNYQASEESEGFYAEGPYYWHYASLNLIPFFEAFKNVAPDGFYTWSCGDQSKIIRHPSYDLAYYNIFNWVFRILTPDGRIPWIDDSSNFISPYSFSIYHKDFNYKYQNKNVIKGLNSNTDLRVNYLAGVEKEPDIYTNASLKINKYQTFSKDAGSFIIRGSHDLYLCLNAQNSRALFGDHKNGHNQGDETSFYIMYAGKEIILDPGYLSWGQRSKVSHASDHNLVLIDGKGPGDNDYYHANGTIPDVSDEVDFVYSSSCDDMILDPYVKIESRYAGVKNERFITKVNDRFFVVIDNLSDKYSHTYEHQINGKGHYRSSEKWIDTWTNGHVKTFVVSVSNTNDSIQRLEKDVHETAGRKVGHHTRVVTKDTGKEILFMSTIFPIDTLETDLEPEFTKIDLDQDSSALHFSDVASNNDYIIFSQKKSISKSIKIISKKGNSFNEIVTNAKAFICSFDLKTKSIKSIRIIEGTQFRYGDLDYDSNSKRLNVVDIQ